MRVTAVTPCEHPPGDLVQVVILAPSGNKVKSPILSDFLYGFLEAFIRFQGICERKKSHAIIPGLQVEGIQLGIKCRNCWRLEIK